MFELAAAVNVGIAAAYVAIGGFIVPQLGLRRWAALFGAAFFLTCAFTHAELAVHALLDRPGWMVSGHMWAIHGLQLVVDWAFIAAMAPWRGAAASTLARRVESFLARSGDALTAEERRLVTAVSRAGTTHHVSVEELHRAIEDFAEQKRVEQRKDEFIAYASHELRTPAAVLYGGTKTLFERRSELSAEQKDALIAALAEQGERLKRMIDQLLDLSRHETGQVEVTLRPLRLRETLAGLVGDDRVRIEVPDDLVVEADEQALERVIGNLVANALRYGAEPVTVSARPDGDGVVVAVEDRGPGVPPEFVPQLFLRFTRSPATAADVPEGAGLGLAIAAAYAEAQGGELRYVAAEPHGARFELRLGAPAVRTGSGSRRATLAASPLRL